MTDQTINDLADEVISCAREKGIKLTTAESCTGGLIGGALTSIAGSSDVYDGGVVTYSYEAKRDLLGVSWDELNEKGAVSAEIAEQMAEGALASTNGRAGIAISVTGIAGPGGGTPDKPVGLVYFGIGQVTGALECTISHDRQIFEEPDREAVRKRTVEHALKLFLSAIQKAHHKFREHEL